MCLWAVVCCNSIMVQGMERAPPLPAQVVDSMLLVEAQLIGMLSQYRGQGLRVLSPSTYSHVEVDEPALGCGHAAYHRLEGARQAPRWHVIPRRSPTQTRSRASACHSVLALVQASSSARVGCADRVGRGARSQRDGRTPRR